MTTPGQRPEERNGTTEHDTYLMELGLELGVSPLPRAAPPSRGTGPEPDRPGPGEQRHP
ncbi:hypothetical protein [Nocardiopsis ansamitocini]|uniref:Uncharacterized protein n=1 Tax=Nocardiopsis ansamitocini TaxID=1670832 RepID=A0A9W6P1X9_9ACTN|nr:hypothetical protein [Nocardiopsis ansamitocini]GLU45685.1 hypothetical protein Nans01_00360 [Nocardiopsis ansamitocini]